MATKTPGWNAQQSGWRTLKGLHPAPLDLRRISLIRDKTPEYLALPGNLERLLPDLGLNDEGLNEFPESLHPFCGYGLRIWQYPVQFGRYLARLGGLEVESYLELGIRHGGSFVATVEVLDRFSPLAFAVGVDIIPCPAMIEYGKLNPRAEFACMNTQGAGFTALVDRLKPIDLVFIDSHHEESQCRREFASVRDSTNMIAFHDIANVNCPGIARVWDDVKADAGFDCSEYTDQYGAMGPYMGIGLAVKKERLAAGDGRLQAGRST
ncbi:MAG: class I SAM-dependent methyltransferase [Betaproteobacteria bacterium]|nr:class I SAM-dependent methyltransferase [Betaproteobacteria bacterium]